MRNTNLLLSFLVSIVVFASLSAGVFAQIYTTETNQHTFVIDFNVTMTNSTGYIVGPGQAGMPGAMMFNATLNQEPAAGTKDNITFLNGNITTQFRLGGDNGTTKYTLSLWFNDTSNTPNSVFKIIIYGLTNGTRTASQNSNGSLSVHFVPFNYYPYVRNQAKPADFVNMIGGFFINATNITYDNITVAYPRYGFMPQYVYKCNTYNNSFASVLTEPSYGCTSWGGSDPVVQGTNMSFNGTHINVNFTYVVGLEINGTFFGEKQFNMIPLVSATGNSYDANFTVVSWANRQKKYISPVPFFEMNETVGRPYMATQGYANFMFWSSSLGVGAPEVAPMEEPNVTEMMVYNLTFNVTATPTGTGDPRFVNVTVKPRYFSYGTVSGNETRLMPVWNGTMGVFFGGSGNKTMNLVFPNMSQIVYQTRWNGSTYICRWQTSQSPESSQRLHYSNISNRATMGYPCNATTAEYDLSTGEINISVASYTNQGDEGKAGNTSVSMLFMLGQNNDQRTRAAAFSPVYLMNQTITGFGFTPDVNSSAPKPGDSAFVNFFVQFNVTSRNFTTTNGTDLIVRFMLPLNITVWEGAILNSSVNISATLTNSFKLWMANNTSVANRVYDWTMLANSTHILSNATTVNGSAGLIYFNQTGTAIYTTARPGQAAWISGDRFVNVTERNFTMIDNFPFSPSNGKNVSMWFALVDVNLTYLNGWMPIINPNTPMNVTLNLTANMAFQELVRNDQAPGTVGRNLYNSSVSVSQPTDMDFSDQLENIASSARINVYVDGQTYSKWRKGSFIVTFESAGTHTVSFDYDVSSSTGAGTAITPTSSGSTSTTTTTGKVTKTYTTIEKGAAQSLSASDLEGTKLTGLTINVKNKVNTVTITVQKLGTTAPSDVSDLSVKKYEYISVAHTNVADSDLSSVTFNFKIEKTWFTTNGVDKSKISLYRYTGGKWTELTTTKANEDSDYVYYSATSAGLSTFLIGESGSTQATPVASPTTTTDTTTSTTTTPTEPTTTEQPATEQPTTTTQVPAVDSSLVIIGIVAIIVAGVLVAWKKKLIKI